MSRKYNVKEIHLRVDDIKGATWMLRQKLAHQRRI